MLNEKDAKIADLTKIIDSLYDLNNQLNHQLRANKTNVINEVNFNEGKEKLLENEIQTLLIQMQNDVRDF